MNGQNRRTVMLLALLGVAVYAWFRWGGALPGSSGGRITELSPIDTQSLKKRLEQVNTVSAILIGSPGEASRAERNLFQYGAARPAPPPPLTEEQRRAQQAALEAQEKALKEQRALEEERRRLAEAELKRQQELQQQAPPAPPPVAEATPLEPARPVKPPPPAINLRLVGLMGPARRPVGVFAEGENVFLAREGEVVAGKFRVVDIGVEWAVMGYIDPDYKDQKKLNLGH